MIGLPGNKGLQGKYISQLATDITESLLPKTLLYIAGVQGEKGEQGAQGLIGLQGATGNITSRQKCIQ